MSPVTKRPTVDLDAIAKRCEALNLLHAAQALPELLEEASRDDLTPMHYLDRVLQQELERKNERRIVTSLKLSGLPQGKPSRASTGPSSPGPTAASWTRWPPARSSGKLITSCSWARRGSERAISPWPSG